MEEFIKISPEMILLPFFGFLRALLLSSSLVCQLRAGTCLTVRAAFELFPCGVWGWWFTPLNLLLNMIVDFVGCFVLW
jgi:hypothetical protein